MAKAPGKSISGRLTRRQVSVKVPGKVVDGGLPQGGDVWVLLGPLWLKSIKHQSENSLPEIRVRVGKVSAKAMLARFRKKRAK
jgi:hypothetical protein